MIYVGAKTKHAADIIKITCADRKNGTCYAEPFVGGGAVISRVKDEPRIANDLNWRMIELLDAAGNRGWEPPDNMTEDEYNAIRNDPDSYPPELVVFAATGLSFGAIWMAAWARNKDGLDYYAIAKRSVARDAPGLRGVKFYSMRYEDFTPHIPPGSIVYCDPPYAGTTGYGGAKTEINEGESLSLNTWNRAAFWRWADKLVEAGQRVFVSEYNGPPAAIYPESHDLKIEKQEWAARFKKLQTDQKSGREDREAAAKMIKDVEARIMKDRERTAARWQVTWEKEVVSSFDSGRGEEGKREVERLFHRAP